MTEPHVTTTPLTEKTFFKRKEKTQLLINYLDSIGAEQGYLIKPKTLLAMDQFADFGYDNLRQALCGWRKKNVPKGVNLRHHKEGARRLAERRGVDFDTSKIAPMQRRNPPHAQAGPPPLLPPSPDNVKDIQEALRTATDIDEKLCKEYILALARENPLDIRIAGMMLNFVDKKKGMAPSMDSNDLGVDSETLLAGIQKMKSGEPDKPESKEETIDLEDEITDQWTIPPTQ